MSDAAQSDDVRGSERRSTTSFCCNMRPRLVEEGKPIPQNGSEANNNDHSSSLLVEHDSANPDRYVATQTSTSIFDNDRGQANSKSEHTSSLLSSLSKKNSWGGGSSSSLARRSGYNHQNSPSRLQTSFEVGSPPSKVYSGGTKDKDDSFNGINRQRDSQMNLSMAVDEGSVIHQISVPKNNFDNGLHEKYKLKTSIEIGANDEGDNDDSMDVDNQISHECVDSINCHGNGHQTRDYHGLNHSIVTQPLSSMTTSSRMEIDDSLPKSPLVVIDGANLAHSYARTLSHGTSNISSLSATQNPVEPDVRGIQIASSYFINAGCRVQIVIPTYWLRRKPKSGNNASENALMMTEQMEILQSLQSQNLLLCSPPTDDDDAYAIAVARREDARCQSRQQMMMTDAHQQSLDKSTTCEVMAICGAFILSNDLFRDAINRDGSGELRSYLIGDDYGSKGGGLSGRISYSFCDVGCMDLDFVPNPRHLLVEIIERYNQKQAAQGSQANF